MKKDRNDFTNGSENALEILEIQKTHNTPHVLFNQNGNLLISGRAYHEDGGSFFDSLFIWIEGYIKSPSRETVFSIYLEYYNDITSKTLLQLIKKLNNACENFKVLWYYDKHDDDLRELGETISKICDCEISLLEKEDKENVINLIDVLETLKLHPIKHENSSLYFAHCPINKAHHMIADNHKGEWACPICKESGDILDLKYQECLSDIESMRDNISTELDKLNAIAGTQYSLNQAVNHDIQENDNEDFKKQLAKFKALTETYRQRYQMLDQYRLSVMNRDLDAGKQLNDDIQAWWANRY